MYGYTPRAPALLLNELASALPRPSFSATKHAWRFANGPDSRTIDDADPWTAIFGDSAESKSMQQAVAVAAAGAGRASYFAGGESFGMTASAGAFFMNYRKMSEAGLASSTPWAWGTWGTSNIFNGTRTTGTAPQVRLELQKYQVAWHEQSIVNELAANKVSRSATPATYTVDLAKWASNLTKQLRWSPQVVVLTKGKVSHAVLALKGTTTGTGLKRQTFLTVYDPNMPGYTWGLVLATGTGTWSYSYPWWKGTVTMGSKFSGDGLSYISPAKAAAVVRSGSPLPWSVGPIKNAADF